MAVSGEEGLVDEAQKAMEEAEALKKVTATRHPHHLNIQGVQGGVSIRIEIRV